MRLHETVITVVVFLFSLLIFGRSGFDAAITAVLTLYLGLWVGKQEARVKQFFINIMAKIGM